MHQGLKAVTTEGSSEGTPSAVGASAAAGLGPELLLLDEEEESKLLGDLPEALRDVPDALCPLVITFRK